MDEKEFTRYVQEQKQWPESITGLHVRIAVVCRDSQIEGAASE